MGAPSIGYRSAKFNPSEWNENNYNRFYQSFMDRNDLDKTRQEAKSTTLNSKTQSDHMQANNTKRLNDRCRDIDAWKRELNSMIEDMSTETESLMGQKNRIEAALRALEVPRHISIDNLNCRQNRLGVDLVQDEPELQLLKEVEVINSARELLARTLQETEIQIKRNRAEKNNLEFDWSDKKEAKELDNFCGGLRNQNTRKMYYPGVARLQEIQSTPESWAQYSHDNIEKAEQERAASMQLRSLIDNAIVDIGNDVMRQAGDVDRALKMRLAEMESLKYQLEEELKKTCASIGKAEESAEEIKIRMQELENPMKVAQTRLHVREGRPRVELTRDPAQFGLIEEVNELEGWNIELERKLSEVENDLRKLEEHRMGIEKDLLVKKNSIFIDSNKCLPYRATRYPTLNKLQGY